MKIETSEATGQVLDWLVAKCEKKHLRLYEGTLRLDGMVTKDQHPADCEEWEPSIDWAQGGFIIERERLNFLGYGDGFSAFYSRGRTVNQRWDGPTHLIAGMRCFVVKNLGYEVDVPEWLLRC